MADKINNDTFDNLLNPQSENISDEIISTNDTEIIIPNQKTEKMEVHHHPDLHHKSKKWKEYFLEFLMIFLAVSMGFIAENIREHFSEKKIARQNLEAYRNDLLQHKKYYKETVAEFNSVLPIYDSLVMIFHEKKENTELPVVSKLMLRGTLNYVVTINTPTYEQLISSGSLRFLENKDLKASMANYQSQINSYINYNDKIITAIDNHMVEMGRIVDYHDFWNKEKMGNFKTYVPEMEPFSLTKEQRNSIIENNKIYSVQFQAGIAQINSLLKSNESLVKLLDKELDK